VKPAPFRHFVPTTVDQCVQLLSEHGDDAKVLAGGQSLVPLMNLRLAAPEVLIDLGRVQELRQIEDDGQHLTIGAMARHRDLVFSDTVKAACPLLSEAASLIGYPAIRNRGTFGGSVAHADPASELPCVSVTLDAEFVLASARGRRTVPASEFFVSHFTTVLEPDELLVQARFPRQAQDGASKFLEFSRKTGDFAVAAVAVDLPSSGGARIGVAGVGDRPWRASAAEQALSNGHAGEEAVERAARGAHEQALGATEGHPDGPYRAHVVETLVRRALNDTTGER
jgi:carbon-monoxide dehydrogenase medium subunit